MTSQETNATQATVQTPFSTVSPPKTSAKVAVKNASTKAGAKEIVKNASTAVSVESKTSSNSLGDVLAKMRHETVLTPTEAGASKSHESWTKDIDPRHYETIEKHNFKSLDDAFDHVQNTQSLYELNKNFSIPDEGSSEEDISRYKEVIGGAKDISEYDPHSFAGLEENQRDLLMETFLAGGCSPWQAQQMAQYYAGVIEQTRMVEAEQDELATKQLQAEFGANFEPTLRKISALLNHLGWESETFTHIAHASGDVVKTVKQFEALASFMEKGAGFTVNTKANQSLKESLEKDIKRSQTDAFAKRYANGDPDAKAFMQSIIERQTQMLLNNR